MTVNKNCRKKKRTKTLEYRVDFFIKMINTLPEKNIKHHRIKQTLFIKFTCDNTCYMTGQTSQPEQLFAIQWHLQRRGKLCSISLTFCSTNYIENLSGLRTFLTMLYNLCYYYTSKEFFLYETTVDKITLEMYY